MTYFEEYSSTPTNSAAAIRDKVEIITYDIPSSQSATFEKAADLAFFYRIETSHPARIRCYSSTSAMNLDASRPSYQKPRVWGYNNHGCIFDVVLGANSFPLTLDFAPVPIFAGNSFNLLIENLLATNIMGTCNLYYLG